MGRRLQGAALRAKKREAETAREMEAASANDIQVQEVANQTDQELFVLDTTPSNAKNKKSNNNDKELSNKKEKDPRYTKSAAEQAKIEKLVQTHTSEQLQEMVERGRKATEMIARSNKSKQPKVFLRPKRAAPVKPSFDLWDDDGNDDKNANQTSSSSSSKKAKIDHDVSPGIGSTLAGIRPTHAIKKRNIKPLVDQKKDQKLSIDVAKSGQSYLPDRKLHQDALQQALQVEEAREKAIQIKEAPISTGMSEETRKYLVGDSDTEESEDEGDGDDNQDDEELTTKKKKVQEKLTRAQRNRQKRIRAEEKEIRDRKRQKKLQNAIGEAKTISKLLKKEEQEKIQKRQEMAQKKQESKRILGKDTLEQIVKENPIHAPTFPVALPSEVFESDNKNKQPNGNKNNNKKAALRTLKPKGSLITDRMTSFFDRNMATKKVLARKKVVQGKRRRKIKSKIMDNADLADVLGA